MTAETLSKPGPSGGWNTISDLAEMPPNDAVILDNWFPGPNGVQTRRGSRVHTTGGMGGARVETLFTYAGVAGEVLFGFANDKIYDCSTFNTTATDVTAGSAITSNQWQTINFGGYGIAFNGADVARKYDGSVWSDAVYTGSGLTATNLIQATAYRSRLYIVEKDSMSYWYGATNAVTGALTEVDLSTIFQRGGVLMAVGTWTRDSGNGPEDYFVAISSTGEFLLYQGSDPGSAAWTIVGRFKMGAPIGRRCLETFGPELVVITQDGLMPLSTVLSRGQIDSGIAAAISTKIQPSFTQAAVNYGTNLGWQVCLYPLGNYLLVNIPVQSSGSSVTSWQYVVSTLTAGWCRFTGQNAICWQVFDDVLYFGTGSGTVLEADYGYSDGSTGVSQTNGDYINYDMKTAWDFYGAERGRLKQFQMVRPLIQANGPVTATVEAQVDFSTSAPTTTISAGAGSTPWGSPWGSPWGDAQRYTKDWFSTGNIGYCAAHRFLFQSKTQRFTLSSYDVMLERLGFV